MTRKFLAVAVLAACAVAGGASSSMAGTIDRREREQQERIWQGVRSGGLSASEMARLEAQEARIRAEEARYRRSGGRLTPRERRDLQRDLNQESRRIYRAKHDGQGR
jgi:Spy/CpxP family protein refolding chaperone